MKFALEIRKIPIKINLFSLTKTIAGSFFNQYILLQYPEQTMKERQIPESGGKGK
jgi:hypothetical protein